MVFTRRKSKKVNVVLAYIRRVYVMVESTVSDRLQKADRLFFTKIDKYFPASVVEFEGSVTLMGDRNGVKLHGTLLAGCVVHRIIIDLCRVLYEGPAVIFLFRCH